MTYFARFYHLPLASGSRPTPRSFDLRVRADGEGHDFADGGIRLRDVTVRYGRRIALEAVSGEFASGSLTAVVGANGAGKSTLLAAIAGVERLAGGVVNGPARQRLAYLPQLAAIDREYPLTVSELITLGAWREFGAFRSPGTALRTRAAAVAETLGLAGRLARPIGEISVGELQRALFARLILQDAAVILLDEPFAAVDAQTVSVLLDQVVRWHREGRTVIAVLHDLELVQAHFPSTVVLARRCVAWGATEAVLPAMVARCRRMR
jgi:zinc/manganese transport system ATP-binding protein